MGKPLSRWPTVLESSRSAARDAAGQAGGAAAVPDAVWSDPRDLVARAFALLAEENEAWALRRRADALPPGAER